MPREIRRRSFLAGSAVAVGALSFGAPSVFGQAKPRVVVVGGGPGGATAAKYIARDSQGEIDVVLVEPKTQFTTCFHSNLYLGGFKSFDDITHGYGKLTDYGVQLNHQMAEAIDREGKQVRLADGSNLAYDRLVVAPGIDLKYDSIPGWGKAHEEKMPHAWKAGPQTKILKAQLDNVPDGGLIVMIAPPNPYRCPPGPYERVSMMAHALKSSGRGNSKIIILDPKPKFSKQALFQEGWQQHYPGMIEWLDPGIHDGVQSVDPASNTVTTGFEIYRNCALVNVIPAQMAGQIVRDAGLANDTGFCPVKAESMQSEVDPNIYIVGDSSIADAMPKSGFAANSQAKNAAMRVRAELTEASAFPARYANTCWSLIDTDDTVKVGARYEAQEGKITAMETFISETGETTDMRRQNQQENLGWYAGITTDIFG